MRISDLFSSGLRVYCASIQLVLFLIVIVAVPAASHAYDIGVFYFPGWKDRQVGAPSTLPWEPIKRFPERKPLLGWYDEGGDAVMKQQIEWMHDYGIKFVVFDTYFGGGRAYLEHALSAYMRAPNRAKLKFSILWANHDLTPKTRADWDAMVRYWVKYYFQRPEFMRVDGMPVVFIFSAEHLQKRAAAFGSGAKELLDGAQALARSAGLPGIFFVAGTGAFVPMISSHAKSAGYAAFSAYNYHQGPDSSVPSHSYKELDSGYQGHWRRFADKGTLPLIVPMISGWNKKPWGGSRDVLHDNSIATPGEFRKHLEAAKGFMDANTSLTRRMGVICCWNEYGEGSFVEPTERMGFSYLEQIRAVFGAKPQ